MFAVADLFIKVFDSVPAFLENCGCFLDMGSLVLCVISARCVFVIAACRVLSRAHSRAAHPADEKHTGEKSTQWPGTKSTEFSRF